MSKLLCAKEVGSILRCTDRTAARLMRKGEIPAFRLGGWRTTPELVAAYLARRLAARVS